MDRPTLFHGSLALYGVFSMADGVLRVFQSGLTLVTAVTVVASGLILVGGLYGLWRPERTSGAADSRLAYLMAAAAVLYGLGVIAGRL